MSEDPSLHSRQVENVHLFKALRESEVLAVRSLLRSMAMNGLLRSDTAPIATSMQQLSGTSRRLLEDVAERLHVQQDRLEAELLLVAGDPLVQSAVQVDAASRRGQSLDDNNDVQPDNNQHLQSTQDDGSLLVPRHQPASVTAAAAGSSNGVSLLELASQTATLKQSVWDTALKLINTSDESERSELKRGLEQMRWTGQQLVVQCADFLPTNSNSNNRPVKRGRQ